MVEEIVTENVADRVKDRITVIENVYFQSFGEQPLAVESRFTRNLSTKEQVYCRKSVATEEWQPFDSGWLKQSGMLVLVNNEGKNLQQNLTADEQTALSSRVLSVRYKGSTGCWQVPPGESMRACPSSAEGLEIRSQFGEASFTVYFFPS